MSTPSDLVPVTVVGGYLGAGKTTLLNRLLAGNHGRRLAVLINDFGSVNIDAALIAAHDGETIALTNGCVCCSVSDALGESLDRVLAIDPRPDQILIEASGVADPGKIAGYGRGWPGCRLDAVLVLADAETIRARAADRFVGRLVIEQLVGADLVLLTKCDLLTTSAVDSVTSWAGTVTDAPILAVRAGTVDLALVLEERPPRSPGGYSSRVRADAIPAGEELFEATVVPVPDPLRRDTLAASLAGWPDAVVRVKGLVLIEDGDGSGPRTHVVHRVGRRWSIEPIADGTAEVGTLVLITRRGVVDVDGLGSELFEP